MSHFAPLYATKSRDLNFYAYQRHGSRKRDQPRPIGVFTELYTPDAAKL
jgi:hypothetical protein